MPGTVVTVIICLIIAAALFFSIRKLWRDKKAGKSCCGGCAGCSGCDEKKKDFTPKG